MKRKRTTPTKPRNREHKGRAGSLSSVVECRHMWMDGFCIKCGCEQPIDGINAKIGQKLPSDR